MLRPTERERLQDCQLLIQSARNILSGIPDGLIPDMENLVKCYYDADQTITRLLRA